MAAYIEISARGRGAGGLGKFVLVLLLIRCEKVGDCTQKTLLSLCAARNYPPARSAVRAGFARLVARLRESFKCYTPPFSVCVLAVRSA